MAVTTEDDDYPVKDWQHDVAGGDTLLGYLDWLPGKREQADRHELIGDGQHAHRYRGQKLVHGHPGGAEPHGYYEHPEDQHPAPALLDAIAAETYPAEAVTTVSGPVPGPEPTLRDRIGALRYYGERYAEARADWYTAVAEAEAAASAE